MQVLSDEQVASFHRDGYVMMADAVTPEDLAALKEVFADWIADSRSHGGPWGTTVDGRARFDVEPGHSAESPALRRVASPVEVSDVYLDVMRNARMVDAAAQLVGPNIEFNNAKVNSKQPGSATAVRFHQDFLYEPHTNDDLVAVLIFLDDVTLENGPLEVVPGSHL
ncbi:MAG: phytanoyl-CoA dioxygenase family protein, partial [Acidimicrobiales bacterium]